MLLNSNEEGRYVMIVVTGATGIVGRPLVELLHAKGAEVRAITRNPAAARLPAGVDIVEGDPSRPETVAEALQGATGLFVHPRAVGEAAAGPLMELAREHGITRLAVLAAINVDDYLAQQPSRFNGDRNKEVEVAVTESGLEWVSLRAGAFATNAIGSWGSQIRAGDVVRGPFATFHEAPVDQRDLADVAVRALLDDDLVGQRLELTGPESLSHEDMVMIIGGALGRTLKYAEVPAEVAARGMVQRGFSNEFVQALMARYARGVGPADVTGDVEKALGRPARTFAEWAADHADAFRR